MLAGFAAVVKQCCLFVCSGLIEKTSLAKQTVYQIWTAAFELPILVHVVSLFIAVLIAFSLLLLLDLVRTEQRQAKRPVRSMRTGVRSSEMKHEPGAP